MIALGPHLAKKDGVDGPGLQRCLLLLLGSISRFHFRPLVGRADGEIDRGTPIILIEERRQKEGLRPGRCQSEQQAFGIDRLQRPCPSIADQGGRRRVPALFRGPKIGSENERTMSESDDTGIVWRRFDPEAHRQAEPDDVAFPPAASKYHIAATPMVAGLLAIQLDLRVAAPARDAKRDRRRKGTRRVDP
jgi:hypothetical protein